MKILYSLNQFLFNEIGVQYSSIYQRCIFMSDVLWFYTVIIIIVYILFYFIL